MRMSFILACSCVFEYMPQVVVETVEGLLVGGLD